MIRNIKKIETKHCKYCGAKFPEDSLNDITDDINIIVCESCGTENKIESFEIQNDKKKERTNVKKGKSDKNRKDSSSKKEFNRQIRLYIFRTIYEMLKDPEHNFDIKENQNELTEFQLNRLAFALRKKVLEQEIQEEWLNNLNIIKQLDFKEYYENLQFILSSKRQFKENFLRDFQKAIEFVFELIKGKLIISELETEKGQEYTFIKNKKEIAEDLIKRFGFLEDMKQRGNFEIFLAVFISRYIYDTIKDSKFESVMGTYKGELTTSQIDKLALSLERVISYQQINDEWFENFSRFKKRSFLKNYKRLQNYILTDHLYSISFLDYLKYLIRLVDGLINGKNIDSELKKNELIIARDLRRGDPFQNIVNSNPLFKPNLLIVVGRIAYLMAKIPVSNRESNEDQANRLEIDTDKILNQIMPEIATRNKINDELLKKLYKISKEDFQKDYAKLKSNLKSDQIYYEQVSFYLKWVIETVLNILSRTKPPSKFSIYEKAIVRDLKNYSFDNLINGQKTGANEKTVNLYSNSTKFLNEELEFLKEEPISIQDSDSKWSWLTKSLAEKYFVSVLLPYYIVKPNLTYDELYKLGFYAFIHKLKDMQGIHFSDIKKIYLNLNTQRLTDFLNEKFGINKANKKLENAKIRLDNIVNMYSNDIIKYNRRKIKLCFDLGFFPIKCKECDIGINLLVAIQLHHPIKSKEIVLASIYSGLYAQNYKLILEKFKNDKIKVLCSNHHLEKGCFYPIEFKDIIFKEDLFSMTAEEISAYIDDYLVKFAKTERYREIIYEKYTSKSKKIPNRINNRWKRQIKKWIKKRFVFKELFDGKCIVCGDSNLMHLVLHHIDSNLKDLIKFWYSISNLNCIEIMHKIIEEKCVCLCANCHILISSKYYIAVSKILEGYLSQQEIDKISEQVKLKYNDAIEKISRFKYDLTRINFKCPLKLEFSRGKKGNIWNLYLMKIYYYLEIKKKRFFLRNEIIYDLALNLDFIKTVIERLFNKGYVQKSDSLIKYSLTEKGKDKVLEIIQQHKEKAEEIKKELKETLSNKSKYEYLDYVYDSEKKCFIPKSRYSEKELILKYCITIYDLIVNKGINEFITKELVTFFHNRNADTITADFNSRLIPYNLIEEVDNSILYQRVNRNVKIDESKIQIDVHSRIFRLIEKGFDVVKNGFEAL